MLFFPVSEKPHQSVFYNRRLNSILPSCRRDMFSKAFKGCKVVLQECLLKREMTLNLKDKASGN